MPSAGGNGVVRFWKSFASVVVVAIVASGLVPAGPALAQEPSPSPSTSEAPAPAASEEQTAAPEPDVALERTGDAEWPVTSVGTVGIRFGARAAAIVEIGLPEGRLTLSARTPLAVGEPVIVGDSVVYEDVAPDTDLRFDVGRTGVTQRLILRSERSPRDVSFRLDDPDGALSGLTATGGGGYELGSGDQTRVSVTPAFAYEHVPNAPTTLRVPGSAHQTVTAEDGGYAVRSWVDEQWLAAHEFPIELDPSYAVDSNTSTSGGQMNTMTPARLLDTRSGSGTTTGIATKIPAFGFQDVVVAGRGGIPASGVGAVMFYVVPLDATAAGSLAVLPRGLPVPTTSTVSFGEAQRISGTGIVRLGTNGSITVFNQSPGLVDVVLDATGWFSTASDTATGGLLQLVTPQRVLDTRAAPHTALASSAPPLEVPVAGEAGLPTNPADIASVLMVLTAVDPTAPTYLKVWPYGAPEPGGSAMNAESPTSNLVTTKLAANGHVGIKNYVGSTNVLVEIVGYFTPKGAQGVGGYTPLDPARIVDTRDGTGTPSMSTPVGDGTAVSFQVLGRGGVPAVGVGAVALSVAAGSSSANGYVNVYNRDEGEPPGVSMLTTYASQTRQNLVIVTPAADGTVTVRAHGTTTHVVFDVAGWFAPSKYPPAAPTDLTAVAGDESLALSWTAAADNGSPLTGNLVTVTTAAGSPVATYDEAGSATTKTVTGLVNGTEYAVTVEPRNAVGYGPPATGDGVPHSVPGAPGNVSAVRGDASVTATWTAAAANGQPVTGYTVRLLDGGTEAAAAAGATATTHTFAGLTNGTSYTVAVTATNAVGTGPAGTSAPVTPAGVPAAPGSLTATPGDAAAELAWTAAPSNGDPVTSYTVEMGVGGIRGVVATLPGDATAYTKTGLQNGAEHTFFVRATNGVGHGAYSAGAAVVPATVPAAPGAVTGTPGDHEVTVTWTAPDGNGRPLLHYVVTLKYDDGVVVSQTTAGAGETSATLTGLVNGTVYVVEVAAANEVGTGTSAATAPLTPRGPPSPPLTVTATREDGAASFSWPEAAANGSPVTGYTVRLFRAADDVEVDTHSLGGAARGTRFDGLANGSAYYATVTSANVAGTSGARRSDDVVPAGPPLAPPNLVAVAGDGTVTLTWEPAAPNGRPVTGYTVTTRQDAAFPIEYRTLGADATALVLTDLTNGVAYRFDVRATNEVGPGAAAEAGPVTPAGLPGAPTEVAVTPGDTQAVVTWSPPFDNGRPVTGYTVSWLRTSDGALVGSQSVAAGLTTYTITGLANAVPYRAEVTATTAIGTGAAGVSAPFTTASAPSAPASATAARGDRSVTVTWGAADGNGSPVTGYVARLRLDGAVVATATLAAAARSHTFGSLTNGSAYDATVAATSTVGEGAAATTATAVPAGVPQASTDVTANPGDARAVVTWTPGSDNGDPVTSYTVTARRTDGTTATVTATVYAGAQATVEGLTNGKEYTFTVQATNSVGAGGASLPSHPVTPKGSGPSAPASVGATAGAGIATVSWTAPVQTPDEPPVKSYMVVASPGGAYVSVDAPATTATVTGLRPGATYTFVVTPRSSEGFGATSPSSDPVTVPGSLPGPATGVTATVLTTASASARVTWTPSPANGATITGYRVMASPGNVCVTVAADATYANLYGLAGGRAYVFRVTPMTAGSNACVVAGGDAPPSEPSPPLTMPYTAPDGLAGGPAVTPLNGALKVDWDLPGQPTSAAVTSILITANPGGITRTVSGSAVSTVIGGLANGTTYDVTVTLTNPAGAWTSAAVAGTPVASIASDVENVVRSKNAMGQDLSDDGRYVVWAERNYIQPGEVVWWQRAALLGDRDEQVVYEATGYRDSQNEDVGVQISGNGRFVAFSSYHRKVFADYNSVRDVYVLDRVTDVVTLVSSNAAGEPGNRESHVLDITPDGRYVLMLSYATNLVALDPNGGQGDFFVKDTLTGAIEAVSLHDDERPLDVWQMSGFISGDGRYVSGLTSYAGYWRDRVAGETRMFTAPRTSPQTLVGLTRDGSTVTFLARTLPREETRLYPATRDGVSYDSVYMRNMLAPNSRSGIVSISDNGVDINLTTIGRGMAVSADGGLILLYDGWRLLMRDELLQRTSILAEGMDFQPGALAANNRTLTFAAKWKAPSYETEVRRMEFLREGAAAGRVWYAGWRQRVNTGTGEYSKSSTDASVRAVGPQLDLVRTYTSSKNSPGWFGTGHSSAYEHSLVSGNRSMTVWYPDGRRERFTVGGSGGWVAPRSSAARLVRNADTTYTLTQRDGSSATFSASGRLVALGSPQDRAPAGGEPPHRLQSVLEYSDYGRLERVVDVFSGRALHFTWTGSFVTKVSTDAVGSRGRLEWTYGYTGNDLTSVCAPAAPNGDTRCTTYTYEYGRMTGAYNAYGQRTLLVTYHADGRVATSATDGVNASTFDYTTPGVTTITDARGNVTRHEYNDAGALKREVDALGKSKSYAYDDYGWSKTVTDENGTVTTTTYSPTGDKLTETAGYNSTVAGATGRTSYLSYDAAHNVKTRRDRRSGSSTDTAYLTTLDYDDRNNLVKETGPPVAGFPGGVVSQWTYTKGDEPAVGGGTMPPGLRLTATDGRGKVTTYKYAANGDLREVVNPAGGGKLFVYDELGRLTSTTEVTPGSLTTATTEVTYDELNRAVVVRGPETRDAVNRGERHRREERTTYDRAGRKVVSSVVDVLGADPARTTTFGVDAVGRVTSETDDETGASATTEYDAVGNLSATVDRLGRRTELAYTPRNQLASVTRMDVTDGLGGAPRNVVVVSRTYDDAGRLLTEKDALGRTRTYAYDTFNRRVSETLNGFANPDGTKRDVVVNKAGYDAVGNVVASWRGNDLLHETFTVDAMDLVRTHVVDPTGLNRTTTSTYDANGNVLTRALAGGGRSETTTWTYGALGQPETKTVENGAVDLTSYATYDAHGRLVKVTDPRGSGAGETAFTTDVEYDEYGRAVSVTGPPVATYSRAVGTATERPVRTIGYDVFGGERHIRDTRGAVTTTTFDGLGRRTRVDHPAYTPPAGGPAVTPYETWSWDDESRLTSHRDRRGGVTDYAYDGFDHLRRRQDPAVAGVRPTWSYGVDDAGRVTSATDPVGAVTEATYDLLDRVAARTTALKGTWYSGPRRAVEKYEYDDLGYLSKRVEPAQSIAPVWLYDHDVAGALLSTTDPLGKVARATYDVAGRVTSVTDPLNRKTETVYDLAGRPTDSYLRVPNETVKHATQVFDAAGNVTQVTSAAGRRTWTSYDAANNVTSIQEWLTEPGETGTSRVTGYEYDSGGLLTRSTDGRGFGTTGLSPAKTTGAYDVEYTYNPWGLQESLVEPSTAAHPSLGDRTWTTTYDGGGLPVAESWPGGVEVSRTFDPLGRLTVERAASAPGAPAVASATRTFGYDLAGNLVRAGHPAGDLSFTYDERGDLSTALHPTGSTSVTRDLAGRPTTLKDPAGTHTFTWTRRGELDLETDPLTAVEIDNDYDDAGQLAKQTFGSGGATRTFAYEGPGLVDSDTLKNAAGVVVAATTYDYDADGNVTSRDLTRGAVVVDDDYDYDGAGRLGSWTRDGQQVVYGWDGAGNLTSSGSSTFAFDERSRMTLDEGRGVQWDPRGNLVNRALAGGGSFTAVFDALDRMVSGPGGAVQYDSLDRIVSSGFAYTGLSPEPTKTPASTLSRSAAGNVTAVGTDGVARLAATNTHGDLALSFSADGTLSAARTYGPFGDSAGTGSFGDVGFQSDYEDPGHGLTWMGSRWYDPDMRQFVSRDTMARHSGETALLNRFGYGDANPVTLSDPDGHCATTSTGMGGCDLDAGAGSYSVRYAAGAYQDSSERLVIRPPEPGPVEPSDDGLAALYEPDPQDLTTQMLAGLPRFFGGGPDDGGGSDSGGGGFFSDLLGLKGRVKAVFDTVVAFTPLGMVEDGIACARGDKVSCLGLIPIVGRPLSKFVRQGMRAYDKARDAWRASEKVRDGLRAADNAGDASRAADNAVDARRAADNAGDAGRASPTHASRAGADSSPSASRSAKDDVGATCSFSGDTAVVMADGSRKAISEVRVGDTVLAEDPETGERGGRVVLHVWEHEDTVVDLEIDGDVVTTTEDHPFWNVTDQQWQEAQELDPGDRVLTARGDAAVVAAIKLPTQRVASAYNLTVHDIHTYYVAVGEDDVLVHNKCPGDGPEVNGGGAADSAESAADAALAAGRTTGAAAELQVGSRVFTDVSTAGAPRVLNPGVQDELDAVPISQRAPWHGACAEMGCLSQALDAGVNPAGGSMRAVAIGSSRPGHGLPKMVCTSCAAVLDKFGVRY